MKRYAVAFLNFYRGRDSSKIAGGIYDIFSFKITD